MKIDSPSIQQNCDAHVIYASPKIRTKSEILKQEREGLEKMQSKLRLPIFNGEVLLNSKSCNIVLIQQGSGKQNKTSKRKPWYLCEVCGKTLSKRHSFKRHMKICHRPVDELRQPSLFTGKRTEPVLVQQIVEPATNHLTKHKSTTKEINFPCPYCPCILRSKLNLTSHVSLHTGERPFKCKICGHRFSTYQRKYKHQFLCLKSKRTSNNTAAHNIHPSSTAASKKRNTTRQSRRQQEEVQSCPFCAKQVGGPRMADHIRLHTSEKLFPCTCCSKSYPSYMALYHHRQKCVIRFPKHRSKISASTTAAPNQQVESNKKIIDVLSEQESPEAQENISLRTSRAHKFQSYAKLTEDFSDIEEAVHENQEMARNTATRKIRKRDTSGLVNTLPCPHCGELLANKTTLNSHIRLHCGNLPSKGYSCDTSLYKRKTLDYHEESAQGAMSQTESSNLAMNEHTNLPPLGNRSPNAQTTPDVTKPSKKICRKSKNSRRHVAQQHTCPHCFQSLSSADNLENHIRLHTGETPFRCCDRGYHSLKMLREHIRTKHGKARLQCPVEPNCQSANEPDNPKISPIQRAAVVDSEDIPSKCPFCTTFCRSPTCLLIHIRVAHIKT